MLWVLTPLALLVCDTTAWYLRETQPFIWQGSRHENQIKKEEQRDVSKRDGELWLKRDFYMSKSDSERLEIFNDAMFQQSAFVVWLLGSQGYILSAGEVSVYQPHWWPQGRLKPSASRGSVSISIEWNWICLEDRLVLAHLLSLHFYLIVPIATFTTIMPTIQSASRTLAVITPLSSREQKGYCTRSVGRWRTMSWTRSFQ